MKKSVYVVSSLLFLTAALSGCSKTGTETSAKNGVSTKASHALENKQAISVEKKAVASVEMPAMSIEVAGLHLVFGTNNMKLARELVNDHFGTPMTNVLLPTMPVYGWPSSLDQALMSFGPTGEPTKPTRGLEQQMENWASRAIFSNWVLTWIHGKLSQSVMADPREGKIVVGALFLSKPASFYQSLYKRAQRKAAREAAIGSTVNMTGVQGVEFRLGDMDFKGTPTNGWSYAKDGNDWYGNGYLSGEKMTFGFESSLSKSLSTDKALAQHLETDLGIESNANAGTEARGE